MSICPITLWLEKYNVSNFYVRTYTRPSAPGPARPVRAVTSSSHADASCTHSFIHDARDDDDDDDDDARDDVATRDDAFVRRDVLLPDRARE